MLSRARARAEEVGVRPVGTGTVALLQVLTAAIGARAAVEVGTGAGVSGVAILRGMQPDGVLTSIDSDAEHQRLAREAYTEAGVPANRTRIITGRALEVLPRLTDGAYDLVLLHGDVHELADACTEALRLLRPGGVLVVGNALGQDKVADPTQRDPDTVAMRAVHQHLLADERLVAALLPVGSGVLVATRR